MANPQGAFTIKLEELTGIVDSFAEAANKLMDDIKGNTDGVTPSMMLKMQLAMNKFSQVSDTVTNVLVSLHNATTGMIRGMKGQ